MEAGKAECDRVLVHGLERSCSGTAALHGQQSNAVSVPYLVPGQGHADTGQAPDQRLPSAQPSQRVQSAQRLHGSDATLSEAHAPQSVSSHGLTAVAGNMSMSHKRMKSCQLAHYPEATQMPLYTPPAGTEDSIRENVEQKRACRNAHDMTLQGWVSAAPAEAGQHDAVLPRRRCVRGDSAQSWLSRQGRPAPKSQRNSRIPQPPRNALRPCADLAPLRTAAHSNLPVVQRREQEYTEELSLFEKEFQELDTDPEVLAMIQKKTDVPKTGAACPHEYSTGSLHSGCAQSLCSSHRANSHSKMMHGKGSVPLHHIHPHSSAGMPPENRAARFNRKQVNILQTCIATLQFHMCIMILIIVSMYHVSGVCRRHAKCQASGLQLMRKVSVRAWR